MAWPRFFLEFFFQNIIRGQHFFQEIKCFMLTTEDWADHINCITRQEANFSCVPQTSKLMLFKAPPYYINWYSKE